MKEMTPLQFIFKFIETASIGDLQSICFHLGARFFKLGKTYSGMKSANLEEAGNKIADICLNLGYVINAEDEPPCNCYKCDNCLAARSDESYDRKRDGEAFKAAMEDKTK